jgi:hypothetical protein
MMMKIRLAKSVLEHEEGMTHLWIQWAKPNRRFLIAKIRIILPAGVHRLRNMNGWREDSAGDILIGDVSAAADVFVEVFTREPVAPGEKSVIIELSFREEEGSFCRLEQHVPLTIVSEDDIEDAAIDEEVVEKWKELRQSIVESDNTHYFYTDCTPAKVVWMDRKESEWEKKYRIEGREING